MNTDLGEATTARPILEYVREFRAGGGFYDDDAVRFVADRLSCEPSRALGSACYRAKTELSDENASTKLAAFLADGFVPFADANVQAGERFEFRQGTTYCGRSVPEYSGAVTCRAVEHNGRVVFLPGRNRTNGYWPSGTDLVRPI